MTRLYTFFIFLLVAINIFAQPIWHCNPTLAELQQVGLPVLNIVTNNHEEPTYTPVDPPVGAFGRSIQAKKVNGNMTIVQHGDTLYHSGEYIKDSMGVTIKVRGNTSAYADIKPYKIKLHKKADLLFRGNDEQFQDKNWLLIDGNNLNTVIGYKLSEIIGMQWTPQYQFVNVVLNGQYRGLYMLLESVRRNPRCRITVDKQTGYIIELDAYWWNEDLYFLSDYGRYYTFKYPDYEDVTENQLNYITGAINDMEKTISESGKYENIIDIHSCVRWMLAHDILGSSDAGGSNIYLAKEDDTDHSKFFMPVLWDFNAIASTPNQWSAIHTSKFSFMSLFFRNTNFAFVEEYIQVWNMLSDSLFQEMDDFLYNFASSELFQQLEVSRQLVMRLLNYTDCTWYDDVLYFRDWFSMRQPWLQKSIKELDVAVSVESPFSREEHHNYPQYDVSGKNISAESVRGIRISNVRKIFVF